MSNRSFKAQRKAEPRREKALRRQSRAAATRRARRERRRKYQTIFIHSKQKRALRERLIEGMSADEFIAANADPIWLHQHQFWGS